MSSFASADLQKLFSSSLQTLFVLSGVEDEASKQRLLLAALGPELEALVKVRCAPRAPAQLRYEELLALLGGGPASPEQMKARVRLHSARRAPGEPLRAWAERLQALASPACLGPDRRTLLRDVFLAGLGPTPLQESLCHHGLDLHGDLDDALQAALHLEDDAHNEINQVTNHLDSTPQVAPQLEDDDHSEINQQDSHDADNEVVAAISAAESANNILKVQDSAVAVAAVGGTVNISGNVVTENIIQQRDKTARNPLPFELRQRLSTFSGRDQYLDELTETLDRPDSPIVVVHGLSGVGKSELCNQYAWRHIQRYHHNIIWVKCETAEHLEAQLCTLARDLDINTRSTEWVQPSDRSITQITKDIYSWLKEEGSCLLVLDDVLTRSHVNKYLPGELFKDIQVLITSPNAHWEGVHTIRLKSLTINECKDILKTVVSSFDFETQNHDFDKLSEIVEGSPLAVQICGSYILHECHPANSNFKLNTYVTALENEKDILEETLSISSEHQYRKSIYICFETTLTKIKEIAKESKLSDILEILNVCAYLNAEAIPRSLLQEICRTGDFSAAIRVLDEFSLIYSDEDEQVRMHKLIQKAVVRHQEKSDVNSVCFRKVLTYFLACSEHYELQLASVLRHAQHYTQVVLDIFLNQSYASKLLILLVSYDCRTNVKHIFEHIKDLARIRKVVRDSNLVHVAVRCNKRQMVGDLLEHEDDVDRLDDEELSPLMVAAARGLEDIAELLISRWAQVDKTGRNHNTSLHLAAQHGHLDMCQLLLKFNCSDAIQNCIGYCPIHVAARKGQLEVVELLVRKNPASATLKTLYGDIPLHLAASAGHVHVLRYFLDEHKVAVDTPGSQGWTALMLAAQQGHTDAARCLLEFGASLLTCDTLYNRSALINACTGGHADIVSVLVAAGSEVNVLDENNWSPLHWAARKCRLDVVQVLIDAKAEVNLQNTLGETLLHWAARHGSLDVVQVVIDAKAEVNLQNTDGETPLHWAAHHSSLDVVQVLIDAKAEVNLQNTDGETPLHWAAHHSSLDVVQVLIDAKAEVNLQNTLGDTPLYWAVYTGNLHMVQVLIDAKAEVNLQNTLGETPLHWAARKCRLDVVQVLIDAKAEVNLQNTDGETPLHWAAHHSSLDVVQVLIDAKAEVNLQNKGGVSPLHWPARHSSLDVVQVLIEAKAEVNLQNTDGETPLHWAARHSSLDVVQVLIDAKAEVNLQNTDGETPLHWAARHGSLDVVQVLIVAKAEVNLQNKDGETPLHWAVYMGHFQMVRALCDAGARCDMYDRLGNTPLGEASMRGHTAVYDFLREWFPGVKDRRT